MGDILDPANYVGRHVEDSDKMTLLTKKQVAPLAFTFPLTNAWTTIQSSLGERF